MAGIGVVILDINKKKCKRDWGKWEVLNKGNGFKVKLLEVEPHKSLSKQRHKFREEFWFFLDTGKKKFVPKMKWHQLGNNTDDKIRILEVQLGGYCEEDDIERKQ